MKLPEWLLRGFVAAVVVAWLFTIGANAFIPDYKAPESVNAIVTALSGAVIGQILNEQRKKKKDDDDKPDPDEKDDAS